MSTLVVGGGVQIGVSFFESATNLKSNDIDFFFLLSTPIYNNLSKEKLSRGNFVLIKDSPAKIFAGWKSRKKILEVEKNANFDLVYSLGFPSYVRFKNIEIGRYTNPWEIFPSKLAWRSLPIFERLLVWSKAKYRIQWSKNLIYYETQTIQAKLAIKKLLKLSSSQIKVIPNSYNPIFDNNSQIYRQTKSSNKRVVFCLSAPHKHKNLEIIPNVAKHLITIAPDLSVKFILTIPFDNSLWIKIKEKARKMNVEKNIENIGTLNLKDCVSQYNNSNAVFLPTLLEVFSATYLEAMAMKKPIITSDLNFAHECCGNAALYFNPESSFSAAEAINSVIKDKSTSTRLVQNGTIQLKKFPTSLSKHNLIFDWFREIVNSEAVR